MRTRRARAGAALGAALVTALAAAACGKKAPLRLPEQIKPEAAAAIQASVREGEVTLRFKVPARRIFPEREEPWVLARLLRRDGAAGEVVEAGALHDEAGLPYEGELSLVDASRPEGAERVYQVEFRDAARHRRALTPPLAVAWPVVPGAPQGLEARGRTATVALTWKPPPAAPPAVRYRVYRREAGGGAPEALPGAEVAATRYVDSRVRTGPEYCYAIRCLLEGVGAQVEGPASGESCATAERAVPLAAPTGLKVRPMHGGFQLTWQPVSAPGVKGYYLYRSVGGGPPQRLMSRPLAGTAYLDSPGDLPAGTLLRWTVTAAGGEHGRGESAMSDPATATLGER